MKVDNYTLEKSLGEGMFWKVYLTSKKDDQKKYLTKVYDRENIDKNNDLKNNLEMEIRILKYLNHPNIIQIQDVKKSKKNYYTIYEYCNGGPLSKALQSYIEKYGKPFPEEIIQHLMKQIINAFQYIHEKEIIHRQINLGNILLNYENEEDAKNLNLIKAQIKIINFEYSAKLPKNGLVYDLIANLCMDPYSLKILNDTSKRSKQSGYNQSYDIWYIGSICYEMLLGKLIFDSGNMEEYITNMEKGIYTLPINTSYELISFITMMLQYSLKQRATAAELYKHDFLNKDTKQFQKITDLAISLKINPSFIKIDSENNKCILTIYNKDDILPLKIGNDKNKESLNSHDQEKDSKNISDKMKEEKISESSKEDSDKNK